MNAPAGFTASLAQGDTSWILHGDTSIPEEELIKLYGDKIPEEVFLKSYCKKMAPVLFHHKEHVDRKMVHCSNCHHKEPKEIKPCSQCHVPAPEDKEVPKYNKAHHELCRACHKAHREGGQGPPVKCLDCHKKENTEKSGANCPVSKTK